MRKWIIILTGVATLALVNWTITQRENQITNGKVARLELAPVDPRSLMQGDYMALRFQLSNEVQRAITEKKEDAQDGHLVAKPDANGITRYVRLHAGESLAPDEFLLRYRVRDHQVKFATNAWFFQEGHAKIYEGARYGEFRVSPAGEMLLVAMLGKDREKLGPALPSTP
ncbi:putative membrane-anchored protein [Roseimicrobium gellanilyticum]|uniref:Putative membrane-anchored protein n=1 Tax=Roseimicrobium gellanilyticum TaxID=748857 RepID=A0A366H4L9_9BACT|nr:GDYXXLXY domain-containing protein [Roseimicrobium gellanilyticum]RBP36073.1 putative membrane-anchored protein [Roseimicrobium gellanilyticum]